MRIDELLGACHLGSKRDIKKLINSGRVACEGMTVFDMDKAVDPAWFTITVDGKRIGENMGHELWLVNKPFGYVSANSDDDFLTVMDCLPKKSSSKRLAISGRLDRDSTGLVLLTNNGQLHYLLQQDRFSIEKEYQVTVNGWLDHHTAQAFTSGVTIDHHYTCKPAKLIIHNSNITESTATVIITEGKRHQIKKMFLSCGVRVTSLHRVRIGPLHLDKSLAAGQCRQLVDEEILGLKNILLSQQRR